MNSHVPHSFKRPNSKRLSWFTEETKKAVNLKNEAFNNYRENPYQRSRDAYIAARNHCKSVIEKEKHAFEMDINNKIKTTRKEVNTSGLSFLQSIPTL